MELKFHHSTWLYFDPFWQLSAIMYWRTGSCLRLLMCASEKSVFTDLNYLKWKAAWWLIVCSVFTVKYHLMPFFFTHWLPLQLSPKGDNLPSEAETEEKEMDASKEDDLPSEKNNKEVCESSFYVLWNILILCLLM